MSALPSSSPERPSRRRRMTGEERRRDVLAAARGVFSKYGYSGARTRDIAAEAGINEAMVYRHFRSKEQLFEAAVVEPLQVAMDELTALADPETRPRDETGEVTLRLFAAHIRNLLMTMDEIGPLLGVMLYGDATTAPEYYRERLAPYMQTNAEFLTSGLHAWPHRDFDALLAVQSVFATVWFKTTAARLAGEALDYDQEAEAIADLMMWGYRPRE